MTRNCDFVTKFHKALGTFLQRLFLCRRKRKTGPSTEDMNIIFPEEKCAPELARINNVTDISIPELAQAPPSKTRNRILEMSEQVRQLIYSSIESEDTLLALRCTSLAVKRDVETIHGVCFRLHDGRFECERFLQTVGIRKLVVENFTQDNMNSDSLFPYPELIKTIVITGAISPKNLLFLLEISFNLRKFILKLDTTAEMAFGGMVNLSQVRLDRLKYMEVSACMIGVGALEPLPVILSIRDILHDLYCPNITTFVFCVSSYIPERVRAYHQWAKNFVRRNGNLRSVTIEIKRTTHPLFIQVNSIEDDNHDVNDWVCNNGPTCLAELKLIINANLNPWYSVTDAQTRLQSLHLDMAGQSWDRLTSVFENCAMSLQTLIAKGLCSTTTRGENVTGPVDLGSLCTLKNLEHLEIRHRVTESRVNRPEVVQTFQLPESLVTVKLSQLLLKPHQAMFLLLKLPVLRHLELDSWTDSEATLEGFITVLTFLLQFAQTSASCVVITESRRKMENQMSAIKRMKSVLQNKASVIQNNFELYTKLTIICFNLS